MGGACCSQQPLAAEDRLPKHTHGGWYDSVTHAKLLDMRQEAFPRESKSDENGFAVHIPCYVAKLTLENGQTRS